MDNRWELLEELRHFLEWQKLCGTDVWMVENDDAWRTDKFKARVSQQRIQPKGSQFTSQPVVQLNPRKKTQPRPLQSISERRESIGETARTQPKLFEDLGGAWGKMLQKRPPKIDFTILDEQTGIKKIKAHQQKYCKAEKPCVLGGGRPRNPVLILEGHSQGLSDKGKETLSIIRSKVLKLGQNQIYWLPYPINAGCGLCGNLFSATLECIAPKVVLVMGTELQHRIPMSPSENSLSQQLELGAEIQLVTNKWTIPGIWTFHPNDLANAPYEVKQASMRHFSLFTRLMRQKGV